MKPTILAGLLVLPASIALAAPPSGLEAETASRFASLALSCVHREYPNKIAHVLNADSDVRPPRELTPAFYGCYDWHSSVHGHWLLARLARTFPDSPLAPKARQALAESLTPERLAAEVRYLGGPGRVAFERPYGLAWLMQLCAELREWNDPEVHRWSENLRPLEQAAAAQIKSWLPKLSRPIRVGEHDQTAFSFGLILDWARTAGDSEMERLLKSRIESFYRADRNCPLSYEPSGQDFLSPCIAEGDLMRRVLEPDSYAAWLSEFLPSIPRDGSAWLTPESVTDPTDPKLAHLDGLNLSRAWMLAGMAQGLPPDDPRRPCLEASSNRHRSAGLAAVTGEHYEGGHWLGSFATYLTTARGLSSNR
jgi:hypothetical protein